MNYYYCLFDQSLLSQKNSFSLQNVVINGLCKHILKCFLHAHQLDVFTVYMRAGHIHSVAENCSTQPYRMFQKRCSYATWKDSIVYIFFACIYTKTDWCKCLYCRAHVDHELFRSFVVLTVCFLMSIFALTIAQNGPSSNSFPSVYSPAQGRYKRAEQHPCMPRSTAHPQGCRRWR